VTPEITAGKVASAACVDADAHQAMNNVVNNISGEMRIESFDMAFDFAKKILLPHHDA
jgi:hypothetical protein